jgi:hypothetical protein
VAELEAPTWAHPIAAELGRAAARIRDVAGALAEWLEHTADNMSDERAYTVEKPRVDGTAYTVVELDGYSHTGVSSEWTAAYDLARAINGGAR